MLERLLKNKLNGTSFALRIIIILGLGFCISGFTTAITTSMMAANSSQASFYFLSPLLSFLSLFSVLSFLITTSLIIRRVRDLVPDTNIWPYALGAILLGFIPFLNYLFFILLALLPSNYLTLEKRNQLISKFA